MRVALVTSPHIKHPEVLRHDFAASPSVMYTFAPVGLLSISSCTRLAGHSPYLIDLNRNIRSGKIALNRHFYGGCADVIASENPDIIGFMTECDSYHHVLQICQYIKARLPNAIIVLGGPQASVVAEETIESWPSVDAVVVGEGEVSFPGLLAKLGGAPSDEALGCVLRLPSGGYEDFGPAPLIEHLDDLPFPDYHLYEPEAGEELFMEVGRGCPFSCTFCSTAPYWRRRHRVKSPTRILAEIDVLRKLHSAERVHFTHDLFTADRKWVEAVCGTLIQSNTPIRWTCSARTDTVSRNLLQLMASAGCDSIYFGLESGSAETLNAIRKSIPTKQSMEMLRACKDVSITPNAGFIIGLPSETRETIQDTFDLYEEALRLGCKPTHIFGFSPFAGSSIFKDLPALEFRGHYIDLPLGRELEQRNRAIVERSPRLFSSYFRPRLDENANLSSEFIDAIDEFSPLVEFALLPTLSLSEHLGGLLQVYEHWLNWIAAKNQARGLPTWRRLYGRPCDYCEFLLDELIGAGDKLEPVYELTRIIHRSALLSTPTEATRPTRISTYRSFAPPAHTDLRLSTLLYPNGILETVTTEYNVIPGLIWKVGETLPAFKRVRCCFVWQRIADGNIQLVSVDPAFHRLIAQVVKRQVTVADLVQDELAAENSNPNFDHVFDLVRRGCNAGLLSLEGTNDVAQDR